MGEVEGERFIGKRDYANNVGLFVTVGGKVTQRDTKGMQCL